MSAADARGSRVAPECIRQKRCRTAKLIQARGLGTVTHMLELEARSTRDPSKGWRHTLPAGEAILSRHTPDAVPPGAAVWLVDWDSYVSTPHAFLACDGATLTVRRREVPKLTTNPILFQGAESNRFVVAPDQWFQIGDTLFTVLTTDVAPRAEVTYARSELRTVPYGDATRRLDALARLPDLIRMASTDEQLERHVTEVLLAGIPHATVAAIVRIVPTPGGTEPESPVATTAQGPAGPVDQFRPSRRLTRAALRERRQSVLYLHEESQDVTVLPGTDWSLCTPLRDDDDPNWGLYAAGRTPKALQPGELGQQSDLKFAELAADIFAALRATKRMDSRLAILSRFLSPALLPSVVDRDFEQILQPKCRPVTVLFCDLRGSSRLAEEGESDLERLWSVFADALSIMTNAIVDQDGVIGDFQGDATMGFWGWPQESSQQIEKACKAALSIRRQFARLSLHSDPRFRQLACGIGVAHGAAVAGRIGNFDLCKVSVFGPVVNLAARLETMTKQFGVPLLIDDNVAQAVVGAKFARLRRIGIVQPAGMKKTTVVHELMPPVGDATAGLPEGQRLTFEAAAEAVRVGRWSDARLNLRQLVATSDGPSQFLEAFLDRFPDGPPKDWDGIIRLTAK
ncbi:MAG: adenylate/guanylate cyclase domain-containing protein [Gemmataceae bacterium]